MYMVDTSAWIFALKRRAVGAVRVRIGQLLDSDAVVTCGPIEAELLLGALNMPEYASLQRQLVGLRRLEVAGDDWPSAGFLGFTLRRKGITVGVIDLLLATIAMRHGAVLLHADRDFDLLAQHMPLKVESMVDAVAADLG